MAGLTKKQRRAIKTADNEFTRLTAIRLTKLTGKNSPGCWICAPKAWHGVRVKKVSAAAHKPDFPNGYIKPGNKYLALLKVKPLCGIDQCVNPDHLEVTEEEYKPWGV